MKRLFMRHGIPACVLAVLLLMATWRLTRHDSLDREDPTNPAGATPVRVISSTPSRTPSAAYPLPLSMDELALRVIVRESSGQPVPGAVVEVELLGLEGSEFGVEDFAGGSFQREIRTDKDGMARIREMLPVVEVPYDELHVKASKPGWGKTDVYLDIPGGGTSRDIDLTMDRVSPIRGRVVGFHPGTDKHIQVRATTMNTNAAEDDSFARSFASVSVRITWAEINAQGSFEITDLPEGPIQLELDSFLYKADVVIVHSRHEEPVMEVRPSSTNTLVRVHVCGAMIDDTAPYQSTRMLFLNLDSQDRSDRSPQQTDGMEALRGGEFTLDVGNYRMLAGYHPAEYEGRDGLLIVPMTEFSLHSGAPLDVQVEAVTAARLGVSMPAGSSGEPVSIVCGVYGPNGNFFGVVEDCEPSNGWFEFGGMSPGQWIVRMMAGKSVVSERVVELKGGEFYQLR